MAKRSAGQQVAMIEGSFWSAGWTPWRAFSTMQKASPTLRFTIRPRYEAS